MGIAQWKRNWYCLFGFDFSLNNVCENCVMSRHFPFSECVTFQSTVACRTNPLKWRIPCTVNKLVARRVFRHPVVPTFEEIQEK